jgi:hypothetical protein
MNSLLCVRDVVVVCAIQCQVQADPDCDRGKLDGALSCAISEACPVGPEAAAAILQRSQLCRNRRRCGVECYCFANRGRAQVKISIDYSTQWLDLQYFRGYAKNFACDVGITIQGESEDELPERMLCCIVINKVDMDLRRKLTSSCIISQEEPGALHE